MGLAACGEEEDPKPAVAPPTPRENDAILFNRILDLELALVAAYELGLPLLRGEAAREGRRLLAQERLHVRAVSDLVAHLGGSPKQPRREQDYRSQFPVPETERDMLRFAVDLENKTIKAYGDSVARLRFPRHRRLAASIMAGEAQHSAVLRGFLHPGDPSAQVPEAFVTGVESVS